MKRQVRIAQQRTARAGWIGIAAIIAAMAVAYIAYNALSGLPLESRYRVTAVLPDANRLIAAADVTVGGVRVGQVARIEALPATAARRARTEIELALESSVGPLPADSTIRVRSASPLGATYVELTPGVAEQTIASGGALKPATASHATGLVELFDVFDRSTKREFQRATSELSSGLAGRGVSVNTMIAALSDALPPLIDVTSALAAPSTRLGRFIRTYATTVEALAPVRGQLADLFVGGELTFGALARERDALESSIVLSPPAERAATEALLAIRPAAADLARLAADLRPVARRLPVALDAANATLTTGTGALRRTRRIAPSLQASLAAIRTVALQRSPDGAVRKLSELFDAAGTSLEALLPAQLQCNLLPLFFQNFASYLGVLGVGAGPSWLSLSLDRPGANGDGFQSAEPGSNLHVNYLPNEGRDECEAGNESFVDGTQVLGNPAGLQSNRTRETTPPPRVLDLAREAGLLAGEAEGR